MYLAYGCPRHPIRLQPANKLFLAYRKLDTLQAALYVTSRAGGKVLPQKVYGFGPPLLRAQSLRTRRYNRRARDLTPVSQSVCSSKSNHVRK